MKTELQIVEEVIRPGQKIKGVKYSVSNFRLNQIIVPMSRLLFWFLESDSNNTSTIVKPRDVRRIRQVWDVAKRELAFAMEHNDQHAGSREYDYAVALPHSSEIQRIQNAKLQKILSEMFVTARVICTVDSARTQGFISPEDHDEIATLMKTVDDAMDIWIGAGKDASDIGSPYPAFEEMGQLVPDTDLGFAAIAEPSREGVPSKLPDVPDTEQPVLK